MPACPNSPVPALRHASRMLPGILLAWGVAANASPLEQEPPTRMVPACFAHLDKAVAQMRGSDGAADSDQDTAALYRGREVFRAWMRRHGAASAQQAGEATQDDLDFCLRIGAVMFQFAKPPESDAIVSAADAARAADVARAPARGEQ